MTHRDQDRITFSPVTRRHAHVVAAAFVLLAIGTASATVPTANDLGFRYKIVTSGPMTAIEIRLKPHRSFDAVSVEAASGVASLSPPCAFSVLVAGGSYVCRVDVTGKPSDAAMTLNVVARRANPGSALPSTEIHHVSVKNASFVPSAATKAASKHVLESSPTKTSQ